jgi:hypothetical protein
MKNSEMKIGRYSSNSKSPNQLFGTRYGPRYGTSRTGILANKWQDQETKQSSEGKGRSSARRPSYCRSINDRTRYEQNKFEYVVVFRVLSRGLQAMLRLKDGPPQIRRIVNVLCSIRKLDSWKFSARQTDREKISRSDCSFPTNRCRNWEKTLRCRIRL